VERGHAGGRIGALYLYPNLHQYRATSTATTVALERRDAAGMTYVAGSGRWSVDRSHRVVDTASGTAPNTITSTYTAGGDVTASPCRIPPRHAPRTPGQRTLPAV